MGRILGQAGTSLADVYDVAGSIAGVEELLSREVALVHEMGDTIFSERVSSSFRRLDSGALSQNVPFNVVIDDLPSGVFRILSVVMLANVIARTTLAMVAIRNESQGREIPLLTFDIANDTESSIRIAENDAAVTTHFQLNGSPLQAPEMGIEGVAAQVRTNSIAFRGLSSGFGAGTVNIRAIIHIAFTDIGILDNRGLPVPSW